MLQDARDSLRDSLRTLNRWFLLWFSPPPPNPPPRRAIREDRTTPRTRRGLGQVQETSVRIMRVRFDRRDSCSAVSPTLPPVLRDFSAVGRSADEDPLPASVHASDKAMAPRSSRSHEERGARDA